MVTTVTDNSPQSINTSLFAMDSEIQKVKKIAESFDEKLSGIDMETGVLSVNGKQGVVELTASDVDALPSSTVIPTTTSELENTSGFITINDLGSSFVPVTRKVNNKSLDKDITLIASDVGALPNTTVIPTKTSQLTNDSGFITSSGSITGNAATATTADKVASAGVSTMWIYGRNRAICKTTSAGEGGGWKTLASIKTSSGSIEIGNLSGEDFIRVVYSSDANVSANSNNVTHIFLIKAGSVLFEQKIIATAAGIRIPTSQPYSLADGDIWIS